MFLSQYNRFEWRLDKANKALKCRTFKFLTSWYYHSIAYSITQYKMQAGWFTFGNCFSTILYKKVGTCRNGK